MSITGIRYRIRKKKKKRPCTILTDSEGEKGLFLKQRS